MSPSPTEGAWIQTSGAVGLRWARAQACTRSTTPARAAIDRRRDTVVPTEKVVQGAWFATGGDTTALPEMSFERDVASELNVTVGDTLTWDVQGVPVAARVTSLREVNWGRFEPNFFAVFQSRALETAPKSFVLVAAVSSDTVPPDDPVRLHAHTSVGHRRGDHRVL